MADSEDAAIVVRDQLRQQVRDNTAARTNVTLGYLVDEWLSGHQVAGTTRDSYRLLINGFSVRRSALLPWPSCASRDRAPSTSATRSCGSAVAAATAVLLSSTAHPDRTTATSGAPSTCVSRLPSPPSASARGAQRRAERGQALGLDHR